MTSPSKTNENHETKAVRPIVDDAPRTAPRGAPRRHDAAPQMGVTIEDARLIAATLPRSYEALVRDQVRFRVGRMVYAAFYYDDTIMGFGFPRNEREAPSLGDAVPVGLRSAQHPRRRRTARATRRRLAHVRAEEGGCRIRWLTAPTGS